MKDDLILTGVRDALLSVLYASAPVIIAALVVGLIVGLLQALTQIQDQSLPQAIKIVVILIVILIFGPIAGGDIARRATVAFEEFPGATR
ncbi:flagellar biosynthetic protein FliQ [Ochrobactrum cytisi]|nr:flagellar biosynthetic protein FliQ [Brucella cytisi]